VQSAADVKECKIIFTIITSFHLKSFTVLSLHRYVELTYDKYVTLTSIQVP